MAGWCAENLRSLADWRTEGFNFSTTSDESVKMYDGLVRQLVSLRECEQLGGFGGTMIKMMEADSKAIMPRVVKGILECMLVPPSSDTLQLIASLEKDVSHMGTEWEKSHVKALSHLGQRNMASAVQTWDEILTNYPTDPLALKIATDSYFWLGDGKNIRACVEKTMPSWKVLSFVHGIYAFGLEETGSYGDAEKHAKMALDLNKYDGWATHANVHVMEMGGRCNEGIEFLEKTVDDWSGGFLLTHTLWHKGLFYIEKEDYEAALSLFDTQICKNIEASKALLSIADGTALLLRLEMVGVDVGDRWKKMPDMSSHVEEHALPFSDCHLIPFFLRRGEVELEQKMHTSLVNRTKNPSNEFDKINELVGLQLFEGIEDFLNEKYDEAVEKIFPIRSEIERVGGSHAQRDLFTQILISSCIRSRNKENRLLTRTLLEERASIRHGFSSIADKLGLLYNSSGDL